MNPTQDDIGLDAFPSEVQQVTEPAHTLLGLHDSREAQKLRRDLTTAQDHLRIAMHELRWMHEANLNALSSLRWTLMAWIAGTGIVLLVLLKLT